MGRGRAKAKQTRIARELKYTNIGTDLDRLRAELGSDDPATLAQPDDDDALDDDLDDEDEDDLEDRVAPH